MPQSPRAVLFIDGNNWYHGLRAVGVDSGRLDYRRVAEKLLLASRQLAGIRYYVGEISGDLARFWRTLNEDIVEYSLFDSVEQFQIQLEQAKKQQARKLANTKAANDPQ